MDRVIVLMSTYNGEKYLQEQIDSILGQDGVEVSLLVRDDGSTDRTKEILQAYQEAGKLSWYSGENLKPCGSFMDLIRKAGEAEYYALSDQDDYWLPEKLRKAVDRLQTADAAKPALYCSTTTLTDEALKPVEDARSTNELKTVKQALAGSGAAGCTMCFNRALLELLRKPCPEAGLMHDNWIYKICMVTGGYVWKDRESYILYRQHGDNAIGGFAQNEHPLKRHFRTMREEKRYRSHAISILYDVYAEEMPESNRTTVYRLANYRRGLNRWRILTDKGYRTGNKRNDLLFQAAILFGLY